MHHPRKACVKFPQCHLWITECTVYRWRLPGAWVFFVVVVKEVCIAFGTEASVNHLISDKMRFCWQRKADGVHTGNFPGSMTMNWMCVGLYSLTTCWAGKYKACWFNNCKTSHANIIVQDGQIQNSWLWLLTENTHLGCMVLWPVYFSSSECV